MHCTVTDGWEWRRLTWDCASLGLVLQNSSNSAAESAQVGIYVSVLVHVTAAVELSGPGPFGERARETVDGRRSSSGIEEFVVV